MNTKQEQRVEVERRLRRAYAMGISDADLAAGGALLRAMTESARELGSEPSMLIVAGLVVGTGIASQDPEAGRELLRTLECMLDAESAIAEVSETTVPLYLEARERFSQHHGRL